MKKKIINIFLILVMLISIFPISIVNAESSVNRIGSSKVKSMVIAYTGGNSQIYVNKITKQDGTVVRYVYSRNFLVTPATIAKLKSVLASEYSSLIPDDYTRDDNVGIKVCSDPSLVDSMNENWTSSEWVSRNVVAIREVKNVTNEDGDGINQTAISNAQSHTVLFNEIKNNVEVSNREIWEEREAIMKEAWDEAEAAKQEDDPTYIPQEYVGSEYVPLDFDELTASDIENTKTLEENQIELSIGTSLDRGYDFINGKLVENIRVESVNHVASIYSSHTIIDDTESITTTTYEIIEGAEQTYTIEKDTSATFKINADYSLFENGGKVYVDDKLVDSSNYTSESGSTKITFTKDYMNSLSVGTHNLKVVFNNGGTAETTFTIAEKTANNPQTGDNIMFYVSMLGLSIIGLAGAGLYTRKKKFN